MLPWVWRRFAKSVVDVKNMNKISPDNANSPRVLLAVRIDANGPCRLPGIFHAAGCRVILFCPEHIAVRQSRYVHRHLNAPRDAAAFAEALRAHLAEYGAEYAWVQPGDETVLRAIALRYQEDWTWRCLPVPADEQHVRLITDKLAFLTAAEAAGLPVPPMVVCSSPAEVDAALERIPFPLVVKRKESLSGSGVSFFENAAAFIEHECTPEHPLMLQSFIDGVNCSSEVLFDHGRPVVWLNSYHIEAWPSHWAASCVRKLADLPGVEDMLHRIGALTQFHGLAGVDWLREGGDGRIYLIELNPRPAPCHHLGPRVGVNLSEALGQQVRGGHPAVQRPRPPEAKSALVHLFPQFCYWVVDNRAWSRIWLAGEDLPWREPRLTLALLRRWLTHYAPHDLKHQLKHALSSLSMKR